MRTKLIFIHVGLLLVLGGCGGRRAGSITQEELVRRTQEMMDAVAPGNAEPWKKYFADDAIYADEKGRNLDKAALLKDVSPMPQGYSGSIKVTHPQSRIVGDMAVLSYDSDEVETIFGQNMTARYHSIDTWMFRNSAWQIVASQVMRFYEDPAVGMSDAKKFPEYAGTYELTEGKTQKVFAKDGALFTQRKDKEPEQLLVESGDVFFHRGVEGRTVFHRDAGAKVDELIDRRNNEDVVWKKRD